MRLGLQSPFPGYIGPLPMPTPTPTPTGPGLGDTGSAAMDQQIAGVATTMATTTVGIMAALHVVVLGTAMAGPIGIAVAGAIVAIGAVAQLLIKEFSGCGQSCVVASNDANKYEPYLVQNLQAYLSSPVRFKSMQQAALNNFDTIWTALKTACSDPALGQAGVRCISDRQPGACQWKATPGGWAQANGVWTYTPAGPAGSGNQCWNWFVGYRDPIANDPGVMPDPVPGSNPTVTAPSTGVSSISGLPVPILIICVIGAVVLGMGQGGGK